MMHRFSHSAMRKFLAVAAFSLAAGSSLGAQAKEFPDAPITLYVQSAPGGAADLSARALGQKLTESLGVGVVVLNEPGAGGAIALRNTTMAHPNGYTMMVLGTKTAVTAALQKTGSFSQLLKGVEPIATVSTSDLAVVVGSNSKYTKLSDLVSAVKASPGKLTIGVGDVQGGIQHLVAELLKLEMRGDFVIIPYGSAAKLSVALQAGEVDAAVEFLPAVISTIRTGKIRALTVTSRQPYPELANVPSISAAGFPALDGFAGNSYVVVPAGTPAPVIKKLNSEINLALKQPDLKAGSIARGARVAEPASPEQAKVLFAKELAKWRETVQRTKVSID